MQTGSFAIQAIPLVLVFCAFYCVVVRPGRVAEARRWAAVQALAGGEQVLLACGVVGRFIAREGSAAKGAYEIEVAEGVRLKVLESGIKAVARPNPPPRRRRHAGERSGVALRLSPGGTGGRQGVSMAFSGAMEARPS